MTDLGSSVGKGHQGHHDLGVHRQDIPQLCRANKSDLRPLSVWGDWVRLHAGPDGHCEECRAIDRPNSRGPRCPRVTRHGGLDPFELGHRRRDAALTAHWEPVARTTGTIGVQGGSPEWRRCGGGWTGW